MSPETTWMLDATAAAMGGWLVAALAIGIAWRRHVRLQGASRLVAEAAHELRGPLCAARLALESLQRSLADAELCPGLSAVDLELSRAGLAVDDLSAAISQSRRPVRPEATDLAGLLRSAEPAWRELAALHGACLRLDAAPAATWVCGERLRLAQILGNLVANACEHGRGEVVVSLEADLVAARVRIADHGRGLPAGLARRLNAGTLPREGAGAGRRGHGLAIAARIAAQAGGRLQAITAPGGVSALELELPVARGVRDDAVAGAAAP